MKKKIESEPECVMAGMPDEVVEHWYRLSGEQVFGLSDELLGMMADAPAVLNAEAWPAPLGWKMLYAEVDGQHMPTVCFVRTWHEAEGMGGPRQLLRWMRVQRTPMDAGCWIRLK